MGTSLKKHIVSFSGGKDSTAMLLMMLDRGMHIDEIRVFDTGWEFPQMYEHWEKVEKYIGKKLTIIHPKKSFVDWMITHEVIRSYGEEKGKPHRVGYGWPSVKRRWCTRLKGRALDKGIKNAISYIGIAKDESHRIKLDYNKEYPLVTWGITEADALEYCYSKGFDWGGLYNYFDRVSCFCCPLQPLKALRKLRTHFPELWEQMLKWEKSMKYDKGDFSFKDVSVASLDFRFALEEDKSKQQLSLFGVEKENNQ